MFVSYLATEASVKVKNILVRHLGETVYDLTESTLYDTCTNEARVL